MKGPENHQREMLHVMAFGVQMLQITQHAMKCAKQDQQLQSM
jgi:hypothetical protein